MSKYLTDAERIKAQQDMQSLAFDLKELGKRMDEVSEVIAKPIAHIDLGPPDPAPDPDPAPHAATFLPPTRFALKTDPRPRQDVPGISERFADVQGVEQVRLRDFSHQYSRRPVWNRDGSLMYTGERIVHAGSRQAVKAVPLSSESLWSNTDASVLFGVAYVGGTPNVLRQYNLAEDLSSTLHTFTDARRLTIGDYEGVQSMDDRYICLVGDFSDGRGLITFDLSQRSVIARRQVFDDFDWATVSPSGRWVLVRSGRELLRMDLSLQNVELLSSYIGHGDICIDAQGLEVYVDCDGELSWIDIATGRVSRPATRWDMQGHVSGRAYLRPGWAYLTLENGMVGAVELRDGVDQWEHWGWHRSTYRDYAAQPKGVPSPDGRQMVFASNWHGTQSVTDILMTLI